MKEFKECRLDHFTIGFILFFSLIVKINENSYKTYRNSFNNINIIIQLNYICIIKFSVGKKTLKLFWCLQSSQLNYIC